MLEILHLDSRELNDALVKLKNAKTNSRLLISTPAVIQQLMKQGFFNNEKRKIIHAWVDKVDLSLAMDH